MLVAQGAMAIDIWIEDAGVRAPRDVMRRAAEEALRGDGVSGDGEAS
jgi:shikimate 5-dehydrogenase